MAEVATPLALLLMALRDLRDGERAMKKRLDAVHGNTNDAVMGASIEQDRRDSGERETALAEMERRLDPDTEDTDNIWLRAILDDADNDAETIVRGPLRDIALAGALRKAKQSQRVSYETARALAADLDLAEDARTLAAMIDSAEALDGALEEALHRLSAQACDGEAGAG